MKKVIVLITTILVVFSSIAMTSYAKTENDIIANENIALWEEILDNLEENDYGGAYVQDGKLHIKTKDSETLQATLFEILPKARTSSNIIIEDDAKYTLQELNNASDKSMEVWEELELDFVAVDEEYNALLVGAYEWTEEKKDTFMEAVGIKNVIFETVEPIEEQKIEYTSAKEEEQVTRDGTEMFIGKQAQNEDVKEKDGRPIVSTIGACILGNDDNFKKGLVTTAHTNISNQPTAKGQNISGTYNDMGNIGKIYDRIISASKGIDIAIIEANREIKLNNEIYTEVSGKGAKSRGYLVGSRKPLKGYDCYIFPGFSNDKKDPYYDKIQVNINSINCKKYMTNPDDEGEHVFYNLLLLRTIDYKRTYSGDSGSTVAMKYDNNDNYELIGIYKGADVKPCGEEPSVYMECKAYSNSEDRTDYKYLFATNWQQVEKHFNVRMY